MAENQKEPLAKRLMERPILLLVLGIVTMFVFYTIWGVYEVVTLPPSSLP